MDKKVLTILEQNRGEPVSGSQIAKELGVSRNSVWKAVLKLKEAGYPIESAPRRGYRLREESDILSKEGILPHLKHTECAQHLTVLSTVDSTNRYLKNAANSGAPHFSVVIADEQTAGRGRKDRSFYSPSGSGIYMSVLVRPQGDNADTVFLTAAASVAGRRALTRFTDEEIGIKWVNDLYLHQKKICGILCEGGFEMETGRIDHVVIGIGINIHPTTLPNDLIPIVGHLSDREINRNEVAAAVLDELYEIIRSLDKNAVLEEYKAHSILLGKEVRVMANGREETALAIDIDPDAHLIVRTAYGEEKALFSGEVSIKL